MAEHVGSPGSGAQRRGEALAFLQGGGELGALIRAKDWSETPLGPPEAWPQSLKTTLGIVLNSRYPMFVFWGPELIKIYNDGYRPITGHKHPWALGRPAREVWPEIWRDIEPLVARALAGDPTYSDDLRLVMERSGFREEVYFTFSYSPVPDESGGVGGMFCACTETTARVIGERRLRTLRDLAASPADARTAGAACTQSIGVLGANAADVPFALIYLQDDGGAARLVAATGVPAGSAAAPVELAGDDAWPVRRVAGTREPELIPAAADRVGPIEAGPWPEPPTAAMVLPIVDRGLDRGIGALVLGISARRPFDAEYRRWFELVAAQIGASITNARAAEEERRRADALADLDRVKTAFFSNVSHEFRTPLTLMLGPLEQALATEGLPAPARESLDLARRNSQRLLKLVNSLLDFSRLEAGRLEAATEPLDLGTLTTEIAGVFRSTIEAAGLRYDVDAPALVERIPVDREMWEKIVLNLVSNAFKFTLTGSIGVRLAREGGEVVLTVTDTGIGIADAELPHLFERFHRVRGAGGRSYEGSGIGLALVRELVRLHHGEVSVASTPGAGSTFRVSLPIAPAAVAPAHGEPRREARPADPVHGDAFVEEAARWITGTDVAAGAAASAGQPRILLADDNADMRDYVARLLAPSCRVDAVGDGAAALAAVRTRPPDLILADIMMPRVDGLELLRAVRSDPALRRIPVILVSARAGDEARVEGMQAGADDYLVKPFGARELLARVAAALQLARVRREGEERLAQANRELRDRVAELETLLSVIPVGIGIAVDRECRNVQVNPAFAAMLGLASGQNASKTAPEGERPTSFRVLDLQGNEVPGDQLPLQVAAREGRTIDDRELDIVHDDGRIIRLLEYAAPLLDEHGTPRGSVGAFVDITQRRRAERRDSFLVALDDAVRASDDPRAMLLAACRLLAAQLGVERCTYASVDADGDEFTVVHEHRVEGTEPSLIGAWTLSGFSDAFAGQLRAGRTLVVADYAAEMPDDAATFASLAIAASVTAATLREGRLVALLSVHHGAPRRWRDDEIELVEMTANRCWESIARARAVRALEASERRYRVVADAMPQLVWTAGPDGRVDYYSARARNYAGIEPGDGRNDWQPMIHPDDVAPTLETWIRAMRERTPYAFEHRLKMATGEYRWHLSRAEPVQLEGTGARERFRWIGTATDVHELRLTQERLRVQEEALRDVDRRKDEFIAILAHELRNPLAPLRTALELLRLSPDPAAAVARVRPMMERQVTQMVRLIDDLLDVSRITSGKIQLQLEPTLVADLVRHALEGHRAAFDAADLTVRVVLPEEPLYVSADPARFVQILSNLLHNALKFTDPGGSVTVTGEVAGADRLARELRLSVSDTGAGIPADALPQIFALFAQVPQPGSPARVGLGIGLALARRLAELHGGRLEAASDGPGRGATLTLTVPLLALDLEAPAPPGEEAPMPDLSGCRLLVVDDNQDAADVLAQALLGCGAEVHTAYDGEAGLRAVEAVAPDAVLLDIGMPGLDGYAVCRAIRAAAHRRALVIALTGFGQAHDKARALAAGFDAHLTKPTELGALFALLRPMASRRGRER